MIGEPWTVEVFRDVRGQHPVAEFLNDQPMRDQSTTIAKIEAVR